MTRAVITTGLGVALAFAGLAGCQSGRSTAPASAPTTSVDAAPRPGGPAPARSGLVLGGLTPLTLGPQSGWEFGRNDARMGQPSNQVVISESRTIERDRLWITNGRPRNSTRRTTTSYQRRVVR